MPRTKAFVAEQPEDDPKVIAYRMGQVEKVVREGFEGIHKKLEEMKDGFVSHTAFEEAVLERIKITDDHEERLRSLEKDRNRGKGALAIISFLLLFLAALIGALWWIKA